MKKIFALAKKRLLPLLLFVFAQAKTWALDITDSGSINKSNQYFHLAMNMDSNDRDGDHCVNKTT